MNKQKQTDAEEKERKKREEEGEGDGREGETCLSSPNQESASQKLDARNSKPQCRTLKRQLYPQAGSNGSLEDMFVPEVTGFCWSRGMKGGGKSYRDSAGTYSRGGQRWTGKCSGHRCQPLRKLKHSRQPPGDSLGQVCTHSATA